MLTGYNPAVESVEREKLFPTISGQCYLDHAGSTLYSAEQLRGVQHDLETKLFSNPHSRSGSSLVTTDLINVARSEILRHFNTSEDDYTVIFNSGCTAGLKIVAETFLFQNGGSGGCFAYPYDSHTSVVGMRDLCRSRGAKVLPLDLNVDGLMPRLLAYSGNTRSAKSTGNSLFAIPAQCNFSGRKVPLELIAKVQNGAITSEVKATSELSGPWFVLLDAAALVGTDQLDLKKWKPDFVTISFYKMFGYPTGIGALLVKNSAFSVLHKTYFGGGTIAAMSPKDDFLRPKVDMTDCFEDGTVDYLGILALRHGFRAMKKFGNDMRGIAEHVFSLREYLVDQLSGLKHPNCRNIVELYSHEEKPTVKTQGGILAFNVRLENGDYVGYSRFNRLADLYKIHLRTGCFCNIGSCQWALHLSEEDLQHNFAAGHVCGDNMDIIEGRPTGAVRVSFGYMSTKGDADRLVTMLRECYVRGSATEAGKVRSPPRAVEVKSSPKSGISTTESCPRPPSATPLESMTLDELTSRYSLPASTLAETQAGREDTPHLSGMMIYPIKSCAPMIVREWPVVETGLLHDREWAIARPGGVSLSQKRESRLCMIHPFIDRERGVLILASERSDKGNCLIPINMAQGQTKTDVYKATICLGKVDMFDCGNEAVEWLEEVLDEPGYRLFRQKSEREIPLPGGDGRLTLASESQFLLINTASVEWLVDQIAEELSYCEFDVVDLCLRFRPNLIMSGCPALREEEKTYFAVNGLQFKSFDKCVRCQIICRDQISGDMGNEPLRTLMKIRPGNTTFGMHVCLAQFSQGKTIKVGDVINYQ